MTPSFRTNTIVSLLEIDPGQALRIVNLPDDAELRAQLKVLGVREGEVVQLLRRAPLGGPFHLRAECGVELAVGHSAAREICGELTDLSR